MTVSCHIHIAADAPTGHLSTHLYSIPPKDDFEGHFGLDISTQIEKAKQLLNDAKKKKGGTGESAVDAKSEEEEEAAKLPFFASAPRRENKIKSFLDGGEIIADGETMAFLSASEPWEQRSLSQMFENEARIDYNGDLVEEETVNSLAGRDVGASIYNLRKKLQTEDFMQVFDRKNFFIGDLDWEEKKTEEQDGQMCPSRKDNTKQY